MTTSAEQPEDGASGFEAAGPAALGWGTAFGSGYLLQREIGVGGMGTVWRGWSLAEQHAVAIKVLHPYLAADRSVVGRFLREGEVLKRLDHPSLVKVHDLVVEGGKLGLVMDLVEGGDLHRRRKEQVTLPAAEAARIGAQSAGALAAAHAMGVAHLDLKPANILISPRPPGDGAAAAAGLADNSYDVRLTDFGISRIVDSPDQATTTTTYGTPDYMAPETGLTGETGPACDIYALGITLYEVLVGRTPYGGGQALTVLARHIERMPRRLRTIPDPLWEVIAACTAREPGDRPDAASLAEYLAASEAALAGIPAAEPLPAHADFEATSELRATSPESPTVAVPWLAAVAAASDEPSSASDEAFAAAMLKPPPDGPFSTAPTEPDAHDEPPQPPTPKLSHEARRRAALIGAPVVLLAAAGTLFASGVFGGPASQNTTDSRALDVQGPDRPGSLTGSASGTAGSPIARGTMSAARPTSSRSATSGNATPTQTNGGAVVGSSPPAVVETTTSAPGGGPPPGPPPTSASPTPTDTGWVCRVGGFKVDGALSEDPCIRDDRGTLMLEGELKGTYNSPVVVVVRVDYGGVYSSARISKAVTPSQLGGTTFVYSVTLGSWTPGEEITCQENINPAGNTSDYQYTSNSADIRTQ